MISNLRAKIKQNYKAWLDRRLPRSSSITLSQRRIFIFPGKVGLLFLSLVTLLFVTGINYQNNLLFSFSCLMISLFVTAIVFTYRNLSGLTLQVGHSPSVFAGEKINLELILKSNGMGSKYAFEIGFDKKHLHHVSEVGDIHAVSLPMMALQRGHLAVPRFTLRSFYPLGLLRCWTWCTLDFNAWVYPKPLIKPIILSSYRTSSNEDVVEVLEVQSKGDGNDDFYGFKTYQAGDSLKHVAWRQYAKTQQLHTKEFSSEVGGSYWLDWYVLEGMDHETRLSTLCGWVLQCAENNQEFGLRLPDLVIEKSSGMAHKEQCLLAMAKFGGNSRAGES